MITARLQDIRLIFKTPLLSYKQQQIRSIWNLKHKTIYISTPKIKCLSINLTKCVYKTLMPEIREEQNKWKCISYLWIRELNIVKVSALFNLIYRVNAKSIKTLASYFFGYWQTDSKGCIWREKIQNSQPNIEGEEQSWWTDTNQLHYFL